jgi:hypothetical protein
MSATATSAAQGRLMAVDDDKGTLADPALQLIRLGVDVLLATQVDEAELLARQEGRRLRGVLLPSGSDDLRIDEVLEAVGPASGIELWGVALLGERLDEDRVDALRARGLRWRLWSPYQDRDLRFLGRSILWAGSDENLRLDGRVPTALPGFVGRRGETRGVLVGDLSPSGAFLESSHPFPAGSQIEVEVALPGGSVTLKATVRWVSPRNARPEAGRNPGFGVEFLHPPKDAVALLLEHIDAEFKRFML